MYITVKKYDKKLSASYRSSRKAFDWEEACKENLHWLRFCAWGICSENVCSKYQWQILYKFVRKGNFTQLFHKLLLNSNSFYCLFMCITNNVVLSAQYFLIFAGWTNAAFVWWVFKTIYFKSLIHIMFFTKLFEEYIWKLSFYLLSNIFIQVTSALRDYYKDVIVINSDFAGKSPYSCKKWNVRQEINN